MSFSTEAVEGPAVLCCMCEKGCAPGPECVFAVEPLPCSCLRSLELVRAVLQIREPNWGCCRQAQTRTDSEAHRARPPGFQISPVRGRNYFKGGAFKRRRQYFLEGRCSHRHKSLQATVRGFSESSMWSLIPPARASDHMYPKPVLIRRFPLKSSLTSAPIMRWWLTTLCITFPLIRRWRLTISLTSALQFLQSKFCKNFTNQAELVTEVTRWRSIALLEPSPSSGNGG